MGTSAAELFLPLSHLQCSQGGREERLGKELSQLTLEGVMDQSPC